VESLSLSRSVQVLATCTLGPAADALDARMKSALGGPLTGGGSGSHSSNGLTSLGEPQANRHGSRNNTSTTAAAVAAALEAAALRRFFVHYDFPPYSTGECGAVMNNRRSQGHGALAQKALDGVFPPDWRFPYAVKHFRLHKNK